MRQDVAIGTPASSSFGISKICASVNLDFLIASPLFAGESIIPCVRDGEAYVTPDLEAAILALRLNRRRTNLQDDVDFRKPRSSFRCQADEAG
jgi:hypothetical protein